MSCKRPTRASLARQQRATLISVLGGACAICGSTWQPRLQIDHVEGRSYDVRALNSYDRVRRYWREYRQDVPLRVLCLDCNVRHHPKETPR